MLSKVKPFISPTLKNLLTKSPELNTFVLRSVEAFLLSKYNLNYQ